MKSRKKSEYLSVPEAAEYLSVDERYIRKAVKSGELPALNIGSQDRVLFRIRRVDLEEWLRAKRYRVPESNADLDEQLRLIYGWKG